MVGRHATVGRLRVFDEYLTLLYYSDLEKNPTPSELSWLKIQQGSMLIQFIQFVYRPFLLRARRVHLPSPP